MNFFDFSLQFNGFDISKAKRHLNAVQSKSYEEFELYVNSQRNSILDFHLETNSFYQDFAKDCDYKSWESLPIMTKRDLQKPLRQRLSKGYNIKSVYVNKTSGSSGEPFVFAKDKWCHALTWSVILNRFGWHGLNFNRSKQARFYGIPLDKKGYYKERSKDWFANRYRFSVFDLSDDAFRKCVLKFGTTAFDYINGYTSSIVQFAKFLQRENLILKHICPSLKVCITTSEMLFDDDKRLMEVQFGIPVVNEYGASELDLIAFQNNDFEFQLNSETLYVEILDEHNKRLPYGKEGRIVITSLYNKAHPFIRYDIGDIGIISMQSTIKKPILEKLVGRVDDLIKLPSGKKAAGLTFYYVTKSIMKDDSNIKEFIIEQHKLDTFIIKYSSRKELNFQQKEDVIKATADYLEAGLNLIFERKDNLERSKSGKLKQFKSFLSGD